SRASNRRSDDRAPDVVVAGRVFHSQVYAHRCSDAGWVDVDLERHRYCSGDCRLDKKIVSQLRVRTWRRMVLLFLAIVFVAIIYRWISLERLQRVLPPEVKETPTPEPSPTRPPLITGRI